MPRVVHFEIHASEPERAIRFYRELFGWQFNKWSGPVDYWLVVTGPREEPGIDGGLVRRQGTIDGESVIAYVCTVDVKSVDDTMSAAKKLGAQVALEKMPVPGVGWLAYLKDTEGNIFGVMQNDPSAK
jgi:predicted enzyme related to lactoylglutathione lyase